MIDEERLKQLKDSLAKELLGLGWKVKESINICIMKNFLSHTCMHTYVHQHQQMGLNAFPLSSLKYTLVEDLLHT